MTDLSPWDQSPSVSSQRTETEVNRPVFSEIYSRYFGFIWTVVRRLGVWDRELEDAVHDVFLVVHRRLDDFDTSRPIRPWLAGIATKVAADFRRRACHRREVVGEDTGRDLVDERLSADNLVDQQKRQRLVLEALTDLSETQREVFVLHELQGLTMPEIQSALEVPLNTLYSRLRLARGKFTEAVRKRYAAEDAS